MVGSGTDKAARNIADHRKWLRIELFDVRIVAGADGSDDSIDVLGLWPLQILRLQTITGPASGAGAVVAQCAANPAIIFTAHKQSIDLLRRGLGTALADLEHPPDRAGELFELQQLLD